MYTDSPFTHERKLFGYASSTDPIQLAFDLRTETPENMPRMATQFVVESALAAEIIDMEDTRDDLFRAGVQDTQTFYECMREQVSSFDERLAIASHWKTRRLLAQLALEPSGMINIRLGEYGRGGYDYRLSDDGTYITPTNIFDIPLDSGCPFAGSNEQRLVDPLFMKFNDWSMRLIFSHDDQIKKTP